MRGACVPRLLLAATALASLGAPCGGGPTGDVDGSGVVDAADLAIVQGCFGATAPFSPECEPADVVADGRIDLLDASLVSSALVQPVVPDVIGVPRDAAHTALVGAGLRLGAVTEVPHLLVPSGSVIGPTPRTGTVLAAGTPVDLLVSAPVPPETLTLPAAWHGTWEVTTTTRDAASGETLVEERDTVELCAGAPLGLSLVPSEASCSAAIDGNTLSVACDATRSVPGCSFDLDATFALTRSGDALAGGGGFALGGCAGVLDPVAEEVSIAGTRASATAPGCGGQPVAVSQRLVRHPLLMERLQP